MFCSVCMKYLCNIHYYDDNRLDYSSYRSFNLKGYLKNYREILTVLYKANCSSQLNSITKTRIDEFNYQLTNKKNSKNFLFIKKIELDKPIDESYYLERICGEKCFFKLAGENHNLRLDELYSNAKKLNEEESIVKEYIIKLNEVFKFSPCEICLYLNSFLKNNNYSPHRNDSEVKFTPLKTIDCVDVSI